MLLFAVAQEREKQKTRVDRMSASLSPRRPRSALAGNIGTSALSPSHSHSEEGNMDKPRPDSVPSQPKVRGWQPWRRAYNLFYLAFFVFVLLCLAYDDTILTSHICVLSALIFALRVANRKLVSYVATALESYGKAGVFGGDIGSLMIWTSFTVLYPQPGLIRLTFAVGLVVSAVLVWIRVTTKTLRYWLLLLIGCGLCMARAPPAVTVIGGGCVVGGIVSLRRMWVRREQDKMMFLQAGVQGLALAPALALLFSFLVYWAMLSMNWMWMDPWFSKFYMLSLLGSDVALNPRELLDINHVQQFQNADFPVVIKPSVCTTNSRNVKKCGDFTCMQEYVETRAHDLSRGDNSWVIQDFHSGQEMVVFYYRPAYMRQGFIKTIGLRRNAHFHSRKQALKADYFTSVNVDAADLNTDALRAFFDAQADKLPGYHGGRFDCIVDDINAAREGKGIHVLEVNLFPLGDIKEKISHGSFPHIALTKYSILEIRTWLLQFWIGVSNILGGYHGNPMQFVQNVHKLVERQVRCGNLEMLLGKP